MILEIDSGLAFFLSQAGMGDGPPVSLSDVLQIQTTEGEGDGSLDALDLVQDAQVERWIERAVAIEH